MADPVGPTFIPKAVLTAGRIAHQPFEIPTEMTKSSLLQGGVIHSAIGGLNASVASAVQALEPRGPAKLLDRLFGKIDGALVHSAGQAQKATETFWVPFSEGSHQFGHAVSNPFSMFYAKRAGFEMPEDPAATQALLASITDPTPGSTKFPGFNNWPVPAPPEEPAPAPAPPDGGEAPPGPTPPPDGGETPPGPTPPDGGETPPDGGETPPGPPPPDGGETPPGPTPPPDGGETPPDGGETPPGPPPPDGGETPPDGGPTPPEGETPPGPTPPDGETPPDGGGASAPPAPEAGGGVPEGARGLAPQAEGATEVTVMPDAVVTVEAPVAPTATADAMAGAEATGAIPTDVPTTPTAADAPPVIVPETPVTPQAPVTPAAPVAPAVGPIAG